MIDPVVVQFAVGGVTDVMRAFESIESRMVRAEKASERQTKASSATRVRAADDERRERERMYAQMFKDIERVERQATREAEKQVKAREKADSDAARKRAKEAEASMRAAVREATKAADAELREQQRVARETERIEQYKLRVRMRSSEMAGRIAEREAREESSARARATRGIGSAEGRGLGRVFSGASAMVGLAMGVGGGFALADVAGEQIAARTAAAHLVNSATIGGKAPEGATVENVMANATLTAKETGVNKTELIAAVQNYVAKSSDFRGGIENMGFFAKLAKGTGSKLEDITGAAGILRAQNKDLSVEDMRQMLLDMTEQGKQGAVEISDLASQAGKLGSTRGAYAGNVATNQRKLLALAQLARTETGSAEDAATDVADIAKEGLKNQEHVDRLKSWGVKINKGGQIEDIQQLIEASLKATGGNETKLTAAFGIRGAAVFNRLAPIYQQAGGGEKGIEAVRAEMNPIINARGSNEQLEQQFALVMSQPGEKLGAAIEKVKAALADKLTPWLDRFADRLPELVPKVESLIDEMGKLVEWFADNPFKGVGSIVALAITKEIAGAAIGKGLESALNTAIGGKMANGFAIASAAIAITEAGIMTIDALAAQDVKTQQVAISKTNEAANVASVIFGEVRSGKVSPVDVAKAQSELKELEAQKAQQEQDVKDAKGWSPWTGFLFREERTQKAEGQLKNTNMAIEQLNTALLDAAKNLEKLSTTASNTDPKAPGRSVPMSDRAVHN